MFERFHFTAHFKQQTPARERPRPQLSLRNALVIDDSKSARKAIVSSIDSAVTIGFIGALATIYALTILCGLYPSWLASRLQPADALRYE